MENGNVDDLRNQLEAARADADARIAAMKEQLLEAKTKAKAVIQRQRQEANKKYEKIEKQLIDVQQQNEQYVKIEEECHRLREQVSNITKINSIQQSNDQNDDKKLSQLSQILNNTKQQVEQLSNQLEKSQTQSKQNDEQYEKAIQAAVEQKASTDQKLTQAETRIAQLELTLKQTETKLQQQQQKIQEQKPIPTSENEQEKMKVLEAKISEMERLVALKQAEITKVREKAKTYLRQINAKKREEEAERKQQVEQLNKELQTEKDKLQHVERKNEESTKELDSCLAVIRDKQKNIQMLKMTISSLKSASEESTKETNSLREEFSRYKEKARVALNEREAQLQTTETAVDEATTSLQSDLRDRKNLVDKLKKQLIQAEKWKLDYEAMKERATKAEAVADLLRKDTANSTPISYNQVDILEEKIMTMEAKLASAKSDVEDAEARHHTTQMRLEAAEKALRGAELRSRENDRISSKKITNLEEQIKSLQLELRKAQESAASAQRTAAAAAKAMAMSNGTDSNQNEESNLSITSDISLQDIKQRVKNKEEKNNFDPPFEISPLKGSGLTLATALEDHSDRLGLGDSSKSVNADLSPTLTEAELKAKDKQITLLTSQVTELGALLDDVQEESQIRSQQTDLLKAEVRNLDAKLAAAEKLQNGAPFSYLRTIVVRYLETDDPTLLPVIANILSFTEDEKSKVKERRSSVGSGVSTATTKNGGYFSLPFLGSR